jgi:hypothetical protein
MRLYLDDDTASALLANLLRKAAHDVQVPSDIAMTGAPDPVHLTRSLADGRGGIHFFPRKRASSSAMLMMRTDAESWMPATLRP